MTDRQAFDTDQKPNISCLELRVGRFRIFLSRLRNVGIKQGINCGVEYR